jgi:hypothetical protein
VTLAIDRSSNDAFSEAAYPGRMQDQDGHGGDDQESDLQRCWLEVERS